MAQYSYSASAELSNKNRRPPSPPCELSRLKSNDVASWQNSQMCSETKQETCFFFAEEKRSMAENQATDILSTITKARMEKILYLYTMQSAWLTNRAEKWHRRKLFEWNFHGKLRAC